MSNFNDKFLKYICSDKWIARCYGEYLEHCAEDQAKLLEKVNDIVMDDTITTLVDSWSTQFMNSYDYVQKALIADMVDNEITAQNVILDWTNPDLINAFNVRYQNDAAFRAYCNGSANDLFPQMSISGDHAYQLFAMNVDDLIKTKPDFINLVESTVEQSMTDLGIQANTEVVMNEGIVDLKQLLSETVKNQTLNVSSDNFNLSAHNLNQAATTIQFNSTEVVEQLKANLASSIAWSSGFYAVAKDNIADAVADFDAKVHATITDTTASFSSSVNHVRSLVSSSVGRISSFIDTASRTLGFNKIENNEFTNPDNTDVYLYTGTSPMFSLALHFSTSWLETAGNAILVGLNFIWNNIKVIGKQAWNKTESTFTNAVINPVDIDVIDRSDKSYTVNGWSFKASNQRVGFSWGSGWLARDIESILYSFNSKDMNGLSMDTILGTFTVNYHNFAPSPVSPGTSESIYGGTCLTDIIFKPKCLNYKALIDYGIVTVSDSGTVQEHLSILPVSYGWDRYRQWIDSGVIYADDNDAEKDKLMGLTISVRLLYLILAASINDLGTQWGVDKPHVQYVWCNNQHTPASLLNPNYTVSQDDSHMNILYLDRNGYYPLAPDNLDFITSASGYIKYTDTHDEEVERFDCILTASPGEHQTDPFSNNCIFTIGHLSALFFTLLVYQQIDYNDNIYDYLFIPYSHAEYNLPAGRYRIKTDQENIDKANAFIAIVIGIALVVSFTIITKILVRMYSRHKFVKLTQKVGEMDNAMWNGNKLTSAQAKKYIRYNKKLSKMSVLGKGVSGSINEGSSILNTVSGLANSAIQNTDVDLIRSLTEGTITQKNTDDSSTIISLIRGH